MQYTGCPFTEARFIRSEFRQVISFAAKYMGVWRFRNLMNYNRHRSMRTTLYAKIGLFHYVRTLDIRTRMLDIRTRMLDIRTRTLDSPTRMLDILWFVDVDLCTKLIILNMMDHDIESTAESICDNLKYLPTDREIETIATIPNGRLYISYIRFMSYESYLYLSHREFDISPEVETMYGNLNSAYNQRYAQKLARQQMDHARLIPIIDYRELPNAEDYISVHVVHELNDSKCVPWTTIVEHLHRLRRPEEIPKFRGQRIRNNPHMTPDELSTDDHAMLVRKDLGGWPSATSVLFRLDITTTDFLREKYPEYRSMFMPEWAPQSWWNDNLISDEDGYRSNISGGVTWAEYTADMEYEPDMWKIMCQYDLHYQFLVRQCAKKIGIEWQHHASLPGGIHYYADMMFV